MKSSFASNTVVSAPKTRGEIEDLIQKYGGVEFASGYDQLQAKIMFKLQDKLILFRLPLPQKKDFTHKKTKWGTEKVNDSAMQKNWEQATRTKWRALLLCLKAKLESAASGITSFEEEFLPHFVMSNGRTLGETIIPQLAENLSKNNLLLGI